MIVYFDTNTLLKARFFADFHWLFGQGQRHTRRIDQRVLIEQGVEMGRTSHIFVRAAFHGNRKNNREENRENDRQDNRVVNVRVGGNAVEVLRGELIL